MRQFELRALLHYDEVTGIFTRLVPRGNRTDGAVAGSAHHSGYLSIYVLGRSYQAHRLAWFWMTGRWPSEVDHRNGIKSDNKWANLREVDRSANNQNKRRAQRNNRTGLLGVGKDRGGYRARIWLGGKNKHLGTFASADAAHSAYLRAKRQLHIGNTL